MTRWHLALALATSCALLSAQPAPVAAKAVVARVIRMTGTWLVDGRRIKRGESLPGGVVVSLDPHAKIPAGSKPTIRIALEGSDQILGGSCDDVNSCGVVPIPTEANRETPWFQRLIEAASRLFLRQPGRVVAMFSRVAYVRSVDLDILDGVIELQGRSLDFAPLLRDRKADTYNIRLTPLDPATRTALRAEAIAFSVPWRPGGRAAVDAQGVTPGLYVAGDPGDIEPLVLVADPQHYKSFAAAYRSVVAYTQHFGPAATGEARGGLARAALIELATRANR